jgi:hypothetical protein
MFDSKDKQFIFRQSDGSLRNLYYDSNYGLCCSKLTPGNRWSNIIPVKKDTYPDFFACMDNQDRISVLLQDKQGNIFISSMDNDSFSSNPVLNSKHPSQYDKYMEFIPVNSDLHLFYVLQHKNSHLLSHQIYTGKSTGSPRAIDYIIMGKKPYCTAMDSSQDIYIFYTASDSDKPQPGYRKLSTLQNSWSEFSPLGECDGKCKYFSALSDRSDILHISYQRTVETRGQARQELMYRQKITGRNQWTEAVSLHTSIYEFDNIHMLIVDGQTITYWVRNDNIFYCMSEDNGKTWTRPSQYNFPAGHQLLCIYYRSNNIHEKDTVNMNAIPGTLIGGLKLAFYRDKSQKLVSLPFEDFKRITSKTLEEIKGNMERIQSLQLELEKKLFKLDTLQQNMVKELIKNNVRIEIMEKRVSKD